MVEHVSGELPCPFIEAVKAPIGSYPQLSAFVLVE
jgi:hypothetical protein